MSPSIQLTLDYPLSGPSIIHQNNVIRAYIAVHQIKLPALSINVHSQTTISLIRSIHLSGLTLISKILSEGVRIMDHGGSTVPAC